MYLYITVLVYWYCTVLFISVELELPGMDLYSLTVSQAGVKIYEVASQKKDRQTDGEGRLTGRYRNNGCSQ